MTSLLPETGGPTLHVHDGMPPDGALDALDALLLLLPVDARPDRRLPDAARWAGLHERSAASHGEVRSTTLNNSKQCFAAIAYVRPEPCAFELLSVAGKLARSLTAGRSAARRIGIVVQGVTAAKRRAWQEALFAAVSAHAFRLPTAKVKPARPGIGRVDLYGAQDFDVRRAQATADAGNLVRHLTALPPNVLDAAGYRSALTVLAKRHKLRLRWYDEKALARAGAGAFLAVARGSASRDAGIARLSYRPPARGTKAAGTKRAAVALVGKGIVFDTGGTNLKSHRSMFDMHTDMAGSAVAVAALVALAQMRAPLAVDAWLAITDNAIGPNAYRPQEVIRAANGTTIQIVHSDAEGRLVLADTLTLAARERPRLIVDFATLTGACVAALTERMSGVFTNRDSLVAPLLAAGRASGERVWNFPLDEDYDSDLDSSTADIAQCALASQGDHILAARFLKRFVTPDTPWVHVDLSSATRRGGLAHVPTEITGFGARFALSLLLDQQVLDA